MARKRVNKSYISDADKFLHMIKRECGHTDSQHAERNKHRQIFKLRDNPEKNEFPDNPIVWEDF